MARNWTIHIAVRGDIREKFRDIADAYGMTMSALGSYIIGQYVYGHEKLIMPLRDEFSSLVRDRVKDLVDVEEGKGRG